MENPSTYQVIARRWRPKQFADLVGQQHIVRALTNALEQDRLAHAYLFVGPHGTGKTTTARLLAKALNCGERRSQGAQEDSLLAKAILNGSCMDVIEIDSASNNSVEQARTLIENCLYAPAECRYKVYIIDEFHMLSTAAFNALLKMLEEPPPHVKFIFATTEAHKVLPTIASRCQRFEFRPIETHLIAEQLARIAQAEGITAEPGALAAIARLAAGGMRDAQSLLDQMIAYCNDGLTEVAVTAFYGLVSTADLQNLLAAILKADYPAILKYAEHWIEAGKDLHRILLDLQQLIKEHLIAAITNPASGSSTLEPFTLILEALQEGELALPKSLSYDISFEVTLLKAAERGRSRSIDALLKALAGLQPSASTKAAVKAASCPSIMEEPVVLSPNMAPSPEVDRLPASTRALLEEKLHAQVLGA